jgi:RNA polymerase sigma-54 factor
MNVNHNMNLAMSQRLVMTPMLQQAIKLLQMTRLELLDLVKQELLENPVLEEEEYDQSLPENEMGDSEEDTTSESEEAESDDDATDAMLEDARQEELGEPQDSTFNWEEFFNDNLSTLGYYGEQDPEDQAQANDPIVSQHQSVTEHLLWQLQMSQLPERPMKIGTFLIGQINDAGYLVDDDQSAALLQDSAKINEQSLKQLETSRAAVIESLQQRINAEFEREYVADVLESSEAVETILANVLVQEYYEEVIAQNYETVLQKVRAFTLEDLTLIVQFITELAPADVSQLTRLPEDTLETELQKMAGIMEKLRSVLQQHLSLLLKGNFPDTLQRLELTAEEFHLLEYLLLQLSPEEIAYVSSHEDLAKAVKREKEIRHFLEKLGQSYAHIHNLHSPKYGLIHLYNVGVQLFADRLTPSNSVRLQKVFLKVRNLEIDDIKNAGERILTLRAQYCTQAQPVTIEEVTNVLYHIQTFAPPGIGARDVKECLLIQAHALGIMDIPIDEIITHYLDKLEQGRHAEIAELLGMGIDEVELAETIIGNMSPTPGADFRTEPAEYVVPEIYVYKVDGEYEVVLNEDDLPYLRINPTYKSLLMSNNHAVPQATKQYVDQKLRSAIWFIRSIEQRKRTIYKVGTSIVKFQKDFLEHGISHLKPLVLRDVADDIAMHESTVSRVTTNKYIHTPQGVFELKYFFHRGLESASGADVSSLAVKERIKQLVLEETPSNPLSDKDIEATLKQEGVTIARRTIAKYREELNIPSSIHRKRT